MVEKKDKAKEVVKLTKKDKEPEVRLDQTQKDAPGYGISITD